MSLLIGIDSYVTLEYFNNNMINPSALIKWNALDDNTKEVYIKYSTRLFDSYGWIGKKKDVLTQKLQFPRLYSEYFTNYRFDNQLTLECKDYMIRYESIINQDIKNVPIIITEYLLENLSNKNLIDLQKAGVTEMVAGSLEFKFNNQVIDYVDKTIKESDIWYLSLKFWQDNTYIIERR
jgi:hypothetical protein